VIEILGSISNTKVQEVVEYLDANVESSLEKDVSRYAKGRRRAWLQYEAPLGQQKWKHGLKDEYLWNFVLETFAPYGILPDLGLVSKAGNIKWHRDAAYAQFKGFAINLGRVTWEYEWSYPEYSWTPDAYRIDPPKIVTYEMTGGEVFQFNVKNQHQATNAAPDRWAFNLWNIKPEHVEQRDYDLSGRSVLSAYNLNFTN